MTERYIKALFSVTWNSINTKKRHIRFIMSSSYGCKNEKTKYWPTHVFTWSQKRNKIERPKPYINANFIVTVNYHVFTFQTKLHNKRFDCHRKLCIHVNSYTNTYRTVLVSQNFSKSCRHPRTVTNTLFMALCVSCSLKLSWVGQRNAGD